MGVASPIVPIVRCPYDFRDCRVLRTRLASVVLRSAQTQTDAVNSFSMQAVPNGNYEFKLNFTAGSESVPEPSTLAGIRLVQVRN
jgi:hypothetical protein